MMVCTYYIFCRSMYLKCKALVALFKVLVVHTMLLPTRTSTVGLSVVLLLLLITKPLASRLPTRASSFIAAL